MRYVENHTQEYSSSKGEKIISKGKKLNYSPNYFSVILSTHRIEINAAKAT